MSLKHVAQRLRAHSKRSRNGIYFHEAFNKYLLAGTLPVLDYFSGHSWLSCPLVTGMYCLSFAEGSGVWGAERLEKSYVFSSQAKNWVNCGPGTGP